MIKVVKLRIYPNKAQISLINGTLGCCNWIKNKYLEMNIKRYTKGESFISGYDFSKYINHLKKSDPEYYWLKNYSSKAIQDAIMCKETAYKRFFKTKDGFPRFKSRKRLNKESFFFVKNNIHYTNNKNIIKIPILGRIRITGFNQLPDINTITSGRVIREYNKYYISLTYNYEPIKLVKTKEKLGIDVGIKNYATIASNKKQPFVIKHFKEYESYKDLERKIIRLQQIIAHKVEINYDKLLNSYMDKYPNKELTETIKNNLKGASYKTSRIRKLFKKIKALKQKQTNIRQDFINKLVNFIVVRTKPQEITIEDLDISEMIKHNGTKDATLHKYISESSFYTFRVKLINKCIEFNVKLRISNKYFASSKICSCCGNKKDDLTLNDRVYICDECGLEIDRDLNAAINLLKLKDKKCFIYA